LKSAWERERHFATSRHGLSLAAKACGKHPVSPSQPTTGLLLFSHCTASSACGHSTAKAKKADRHKLSRFMKRLFIIISAA
jgi:hypothetical protein